MVGYHTAMRIKTVNEIGQYARETRLERGWSQTDLATRAQVSRVWVSQFERGKQTLELGLVLRTLKTLGISIDLRLSPPAPLDELAPPPSL